MRIPSGSVSYDKVVVVEAEKMEEEKEFKKKGEGSYFRLFDRLSPSRLPYLFIGHILESGRSIIIIKS